MNASGTAPTTGSYLTITVTGTASTLGSLTNTATVTAPAGTTDPVAGNNSSSQQTYVTPAQTCDTLYGVTNGLAPADGFYVINAATGVATPVGSKSITTTATAIQSSAGLVYYFSATAPIQTWVWDIATNTNTLLPNTISSPAGLILRAAFNAAGRLFVTSSNGSATPQLIEINPTTGAAISTNAITAGGAALPSGSGDMVFDNNGTLFLSTPAALYSVDISTHNATLVSTGTGGLTFVGLAFTSNGTLYGTTGAGVIYTINPSTGATTLLAATNDSLTDLATCAFPKPNLTSSKTVAKVAGSAGATVLPGDTLEYTITTTNSGTVPAVSTTLTDAIPTGTTYVAGSTKLNTVAVTDGTGGVFPYATAAEIHGVGMNPGVIGSDTANKTATVVFRVMVTALSGSVSNQGTVTATGIPSVLTDDPTKPGTTDPTVTPIVTTVVQPKISLLKLGRNATAGATTGTTFTDKSVAVSPKDTVEYCIVYTSTGGAATNFVLKDYVPVGMVSVPDAYVTGKGVRWAAGVAAAIGDGAAPAGLDLTNASDIDQGTLDGTPVVNPLPNGDGLTHPGLMTLNLGAAGAPAGTPATPSVGTVCFQVKVP